MIYSFKEGQLDKDFCKEIYQKVVGNIVSSKSFTMLGMPGVGVSYFLRFLSSRKIPNLDVCFVFVDFYSLATLSRLEYLRWLLKELGAKLIPKNEDDIYHACQNQIKKLLPKFDRVVIIFNRFDQLHQEFTPQFLANLRSLINLDPARVVLIFTANKPLYEVSPSSVAGNNLGFYANAFYFGTFSKGDLAKILHLHFPDIKISDLKIQNVLDLASGHNQLMHILYSSESRENPLLDRFIILQMKELMDFLPSRQKKILQNISLGKKITQVDQYLTNIGIVRKNGSSYILFTPILEDYIKTHLNLNIPAKEGKLFKLLKQNLGQVVSKEEIFDYVWGKDSLEASDWSLNALIYRLRKNQGFKKEGCVIESVKKLGYKMLS